MKLIDKDSLCRCISDWQMSCADNDNWILIHQYEMIGKFLEAVSNAPEVGWIDIRDQKPEVGTEIIGMYAYGSIARFVVESESSCRKDCTAEYCEVDYWLPLPEVPEEYR